MIVKICLPMYVICIYDCEDMPAYVCMYVYMSI